MEVDTSKIDFGIDRQIFKVWDNRTQVIFIPTKCKVVMNLIGQASFYDLLIYCHNIHSLNLLFVVKFKMVCFFSFKFVLKINHMKCNNQNQISFISSISSGLVQALSKRYINYSSCHSYGEELAWNSLWSFMLVLF